MLDIVLVDDVREDLGLLERVLRQCKILNSIHQLHSGEQCVSFFDAAGSTGGNSPRCLVFLDLIMSPISGISVLSRLKALGLARGSVFVMLSGITDIKAINEGYQLGAHTFMIKPVTTEDVMQTLHALKPKIHVEPQSEGYLLDWIHYPHAPPSMAHDPSFRASTVSLSA
jgi:response regulator RpfG family c-di-GMP phosphodiesterase